MKRRGDRIRAFAARVFDAGTMERVIDPAMADLQREAPSLAAYAAVLKVMLMCGCQEAMMSNHEWTSDDRRAMIRALTGASIVTLLATLGSEAPFLPYAWHPGSVDPKVPLYLAPQGLPGALALGAMLGILFGLEGRQVSRRVAGCLLALALAASVGSFVDLAWITPAGNQAFRAAASGNPGLTRTELALGELWQFSSPDSLLNFHTRLALGCLPLVLAVFALSIVRMKPLGRWTLGIAAVATVVGYYTVLYGGRSMALDGRVPAYAAAWLPNVTFVLISVALTVLSARRPGERPARAAS
jgi:hypothetical protein